MRARRTPVGKAYSNKPFGCGHTQAALNLVL